MAVDLLTPMTLDPKARKQTINYTGGSLTMTVGALESLFGDALSSLTSTAEETEVTVSGHSRTRVIGGSSTQVAGHTYTYMQWPTSESGQAAGGSVVYMSWPDSDGAWTARITGSFADFGTFIQNQEVDGVTFKSQRGTNYGPF